MLSHLLLFMISLLVAVVLVPPVKALALKLGAVDVPDERKVHRRPVPRLGGLSMLAAFCLPVGALWLLNPHARQGIEGGRLFMLLMGAVFISLVGALDDIRGLRARSKFLLQLVLAAASWLSGIRIGQMGLPFVGTVVFPEWLSFVITVLWIAGVINAMNLVDGLDGLAAGVAFIVAATNFILGLQQENNAALVFSAALAGSVVGFLLFNWNPALVFMGDTGSMLLGYVLSTTAVMTAHKMSTAVAMISPIIALGVPVVDTLLSMVRRFLERRPLFSPDKGHLHHRLLRLGLTQKRAVIIIYGLCVLFALSAVLLTSQDRLETAIALALVLLVVFGVVRFFGFLNLGELLRRAVHTGRLARAVRTELPLFYQKMLSECRSRAECWRAFYDTARRCGFTGLKAQVVGEGMAAQFEEELSTQRGRSVKYRVSVPIRGDSYLELSFTFPHPRSGRTQQGDEEAMELLADALAAGIRKLADEGLWLGGGTAGPAQEKTPAAKAQTAEADQSPFDRAWALAELMARQEGFLEIGWKSHGLKPPEVREKVLSDRDGQPRAALTRSVPLDTLAFLEMRFVYPGQPGRKISEHFREAARRISYKVAEEIRRR